MIEGFVGAGAVFGIEELGILAAECGRSLAPLALSERLLVDGIVPSIMTATERARFDTDYRASQSTVAPNQCCALSLSENADRVDGHIDWLTGFEGSERIVAFADTKSGRRCIALRTKEAGLRASGISSLDATLPLHRVECASVPVLVLGEDTSRAIEDIFESLKASEAGGICERVLEITVEYAKTREQFGKPIGSFQAIQQKLADACARTESLSSLSRFAVWACANAPRQRHLTARAAVALAAEASPYICESAIQCHGGIGFTWEYELHLFLRRALTIQSAFALGEARVDELLAAASTAA